MDITTATPVEIDTEIARLWREKAVLDASIPGLINSIHRAAKDEQVTEHTGTGYYKKYTTRWTMNLDEALTIARAIAEGTEDRVWEVSKAQKALADWDAALAEATALRKQEEPLHAEFRRRGGWTRAFLATSSNGHIHSSRECSTCYETTQFFWFTFLSGHDEAEIVAKAGSDACTVCYPSAPVNDLKRPRSIFSDDEKAAQAAREERAAAKAARDAKKIEKGLTPDGSEFKVTYVEHNRGGHEYDRTTGQHTYVYKDRERTERFKTEQSAVQWVVQYVAWGDDIRTSEKAPAFAQVIEAVAAKHGKTVAEVTADIEKKVAAKIKRDSR